MAIKFIVENQRDKSRLTGRCRIWIRIGEGTRATPLSIPLMNPLLMIPLLSALGLADFWLFYRSVDFFDRI